MKFTKHFAPALTQICASSLMSEIITLGRLEVCLKTLEFRSFHNIQATRIRMEAVAFRGAWAWRTEVDQQSKTEGRPTHLSGLMCGESSHRETAFQMR